MQWERHPRTVSTYVERCASTGTSPSDTWYWTLDLGSFLDPRIRDVQFALTINCQSVTSRTGGAQLVTSRPSTAQLVKAIP